MTTLRDRPVFVTLNDDRPAFQAVSDACRSLSIEYARTHRFYVTRFEHRFVVLSRRIH